MICETCHGTGWMLVRVLNTQIPVDVLEFPCDDCGGCGRTHCCEGDRVTEEPTHE